MAIPYRRVLMVAAAIAAAAEGVVIYTQWPSPPLKICASLELGELLAAAAKAEAELREGRTRLRTSPNDDTPKEVMRLEAASAAAFNEVAIYKQKAQQRQKAGGKAASEGSCS